MTKVLLSLHVLAAIVAIGPVTVAASMFPAATRRALATGEERDVVVLRTLNRICRVYAALGVAVPLFGLFTASSLGVLGDAWLITSIALTAVAAGVLVLAVLPRQQAVLEGVGHDPVTVGASWPGRLAMQTGVFNLLWAAVTVLMIVRPGSTTGA
ncbi:hypothetical protein [Saccharothrix sp. Mg75]|uniref:hypothetical protein n=1 Tax=Saccharothrix sp. Mg75 TaxID=3445357 RepID=UPI003EEB644C